MKKTKLLLDMKCNKDIINIRGTVLETLITL